MVVTVGKGRNGCGERTGEAITRMLRGMLRGCFSDGKPRWSSTIGHYNLVGLCLRDRNTVARIMRKLKLNCKWAKKLTGKWNSMREATSVALPEGLEEMMVKEAKRRAQNVHIYNVLVEARTYRGNRTLERHDKLKELGWSIRREFDECVILWHVATDICYYEDRKNESQNTDPFDQEPHVSWKVSNYMMYLLIKQPSMLQLGYGKTRFEATCDAAKDVLKDTLKKKQGGKGEIERHQLLGNDNSVPAGEGRKVLADCIKLAGNLQDLDKKIKWPLITEIWMEMLGYAAIHCESDQHTKALSRGGELLTHLWLLMAQLGVVEQHKLQQF